MYNVHSSITVWCLAMLTQSGGSDIVVSILKAACIIMYKYYTNIILTLTNIIILY